MHGRESKTGSILKGTVMSVWGEKYRDGRLYRVTVRCHSSLPSPDNQFMAKVTWMFYEGFAQKQNFPICSGGKLCPRLLLHYFHNIINILQECYCVCIYSWSLCINTYINMYAPVKRQIVKKTCAFQSYSPTSVNFEKTFLNSVPTDQLLLSGVSYSHIWSNHFYLSRLGFTMQLHGSGCFAERWWIAWRRYLAENEWTN